MAHNTHAARYLLGILESTHWTEATLAKYADLGASTVSAHLSGQRIIRRHHLGCYLKAIEAGARLGLLIAWLRDDGLDPDLIASLIRIFTGDN
jgi:hypothetical protein